MTLLPEWIAGIFVALLGLAFGSFVTALSWRLPLGISIWKHNKKANGQSSTRSFCPNCKTTLGIIDLIPVLSWIISKRKCRHCQTAIPVRYPLTELGTAALFLLFYFFIPNIQNIWALQIIFASLAITLMTMIVIDLEHKILPNSLNLIVGLLGVAFLLNNSIGLSIMNAIESNLLPALLNISIYAGFALVIRWIFLYFMQRDPLGGGDIKFFAASGVWLSLEQFPIFLFISGLAGIIIGLIWRKITGEEAFPFGPAIILALITCLCLPENFFGLYL